MPAPGVSHRYTAFFQKRANEVRFNAVPSSTTFAMSRILIGTVETYNLNNVF